MLAQQCRIRGLLNMAGMPATLRQDRIDFLASMDRELSPGLRRERAVGDASALATDDAVRELYLEALPVFFSEGAWSVKNIMLVSAYNFFPIFCSFPVLILILAKPWQLCSKPPWSCPPPWSYRR